jgi:hypothetical protein
MTVLQGVLIEAGSFFNLPFVFTFPLNTSASDMLPNILVADRGACSGKGRCTCVCMPAYVA